jgi:hypothetical protein
MARNQASYPTLVVCGQHELKWDTFMTPVLGLRAISLEYYLWMWKDERNPSVLRPFSSGMNKLRSTEHLKSLGRKNSMANSLPKLLKLSRIMDATDQRDKSETKRLPYLV